MRRLLVVLVASVLCVLAVACSPEEATHVQAVNDFRTANGVPSLAWDEDVYAKAHDWAQHMADAGALSHSDLRAGVPAGWHHLGENVAMAPTLDSAMKALEASPLHRANLLSRDFDRVAVGVAQARGMFWVTEDFVG
jgi:uncharacterized protein YkwD